MDRCSRDVLDSYDAEREARSPANGRAFTTEESWTRSGFTRQSTESCRDSHDGERDDQVQLFFSQLETGRQSARSSLVRIASRQIDREPAVTEANYTRQRKATVWYYENDEAKRSRKRRRYQLIRQGTGTTLVEGRIAV